MKSSGDIMKSTVVKRSIVIGGHKTSVSLEDPFWTGLKEIADARQMLLSELVTNIDRRREQSNLSSAIRLFVLHHFRNEHNGRSESSSRDSSHVSFCQRAKSMSVHT